LIQTGFSVLTLWSLTKKEVGRPLNSKSIGVAQVFSRCFGSITI